METGGQARTGYTAVLADIRAAVSDHGKQRYGSVAVGGGDAGFWRCSVRGGNVGDDDGEMTKRMKRKKNLPKR